MNLNCPKCHSEKIVKNGRTTSNTQMYKCKDCNKYFTIQPLNKVPKTKLPFYFIISELYQYQKMKEIMGDDFGPGTLRNQMNCKYHSLKFHIDFPLKESSTGKYNEHSEITRQRIYYWKKKFSKYLDDEEIVKEAKNYVATRIRKLSKGFNPKGDFKEKIVWKNTKTHEEARNHLKSIYEKEKVVEMIVNDRERFDYLIKKFRLHPVEIIRVGKKDTILNSAVPERYLKK